MDCSGLKGCSVIRRQRTLLFPELGRFDSPKKRAEKGPVVLPTAGFFFYEREITSRLFYRFGGRLIPGKKGAVYFSKIVVLGRNVKFYRTGKLCGLFRSPGRISGALFWGW
jgi:hypothetical protein